MERALELSIVIPALNEAAKIAADLDAAGRFLREEGLTGEVILVDDGSQDGTADLAREVALPADVGKQVIHLERNRGKGYALRQGVAASRGGLVLFSDSGGCIPFPAARRGMALIRSGACHLALGSRRHPESVVHRDQPFLRRLGSRLLMALLHRLLGLGGLYRDTQCGFKLFAGGPGRELFAACRTDGFMIDLELLLLARRRGLRVLEFPVTWRCDRDTRLRPLQAALASLGEALRLRRRLRERS